MKHIVLDTGIYTKVPRLDSAEFKALSYLARKKCIQLHIPNMVEMEFSSQLEEEQLKHIRGAIGSLNSAVHYAPLGGKTSELPAIIELLEMNLNEIVQERSGAFISWVDDIGGKRYDLTLEEAKGAIHAYIKGQPPLKAPKVRKDIPDSFIFQNILNLQSQYKEDLSVVIEDGKLGDACKNAGIDFYSSLADFLKSDVAKKCLAEKVIDENLPQVLEKVTQKSLEYEGRLTAAIESLLLSDDYRVLSGNDIPGEINEIYVSGVSSPHEINQGEFEHVGAGVFVCHFLAKVELTYEYAVFVAEAYNLDLDKFYIVESINDHYVNVETTDEFEFSGRVELDFGEEILGNDTIEGLLSELDDPDISIDELEDFHLTTTQ